ncbi:Leucine-rich repeat-containing protein 49 [Clydaea vesicula]|uniref:U2 small nuclear ribonucleoprotein A' n=1 Tax=Clydaea vesicula TaxID=447962 RepID=A0AAD5U4W8_9FUNG|nr:Leucine-rich repeat-containing protein 49 [Clydaea vesicula]
MDGNTVANEELYRPIMITFVRPLKILDRKRILEEERRNFIKVIKREEEKRKEQEKQIIQSEKKCKAVAKIKNNWNLHKTTTIFSGTEKDNIEINCIDVEKDGFKKSGNWTKKTGFYTENTGDTAVENKDTYVDVNGGVLSIFGPGLGVLEKVMNNIEIIEFNYIEFEEIEQHLAKISKNYPALQAMRFTSNNLNHLYQLESLKVLKLNELSFSDEGNSIVSLGIFRKYLIYIFKNLPLEILNGIQIETCERIEAEKFFAGIKKIQNQQYQLFSTLNSFVSQTLDTMGNPSSIQDDASNIKKNLKPAHSLKSESKAYVKALIKERIEFNTKIKIFDEFWTNLVKEMCK